MGLSSYSFLTYGEKVRRREGGGRQKESPHRNVGKRKERIIRVLRCSLHLGTIRLGGEQGGLQEKGGGMDWGLSRSIC